MSVPYRDYPDYVWNAETAERDRGIHIRNNAEPTLVGYHCTDFFVR